MPKSKGASRKTRWGIPKRVIEGFARRDLKHLRRIHEICFYKGPRGNLRYGAEFRSATSIMPKTPKKGDTLFVHTHPKTPIADSCALPSFNDLKGLLYTSKEYGINTWIISRVDKRGNEMGRTFLKLRVSDKKKLQDLLRRMENFEKGLIHLDLEEGAKKLEEEAHKLFREWRTGKKLLVKFVPMSGYRFDERIGDFVREDSVKSQR
ncbi:MAG: hypothetical protein J7L44_03670 [Candidatus Diapherotrites archaeon]|nr:hypothetical protein [Candidatus Diapherotrites archaeon]